MTRFDAATPEDRQKLFAEAVVAHRERGSPFATFEADVDASALDDDPLADDSDADADGTDADGTDSEPEAAPPWVQFGDGVSAEGSEAEARRGTERSGGVLNLDCTDEELDDLKSLLGEFPAFKIDEITRPEDADGVNVRVSALADPNRVAQCVERVFREVYDQPEGYRAWVAAI